MGGVVVGVGGVGGGGSCVCVCVEVLSLAFDNILYISIYIYTM